MEYDSSIICNFKNDSDLISSKRAQNGSKLYQRGTSNCDGIKVAENDKITGK